MALLSALPKVVWSQNPVVFPDASVQLRYYSVCVLLSFIWGYVLLSRQLRRAGVDVEEAGDFQSYGFWGLMIGARLGHVLFYDFEKLLQNPVWALQIWSGGMASHGGLIGLFLAMWLFTRRRAIPLLEGTDRLVFSVVLGSALWRIGNLYNSEIPGKPTDGSWGVYFPRLDHDAEVFRHPTQLYEALSSLALLAFLRAADRRLGGEKRPRGVLTGLALAIYFSGRILIEFWKEPEGAMIGPFNTAQLLSIPLALAGLFVLQRSLQQRKAAGWLVSPS